MSLDLAITHTRVKNDLADGKMMKKVVPGGREGKGWDESN